MEKLINFKKRLPRTKLVLAFSVTCFIIIGLVCTFLAFNNATANKTFAKNQKVKVQNQTQNKQNENLLEIKNLPKNKIIKDINIYAATSDKKLSASDITSFINNNRIAGIGFGLGYDFHTDSTDYISAATLAADKFVIVYRDRVMPERGKAIIGTVSGTIITFGSEYVFNAGNTIYISVSTLAADKFVIAYEDVDNSRYGTAIIGTVSDSTITYGSEYVFNAGQTNMVSVASLSSNSFVITYQDWANSRYGTAIIGTVSDSTITYGSEYVFNAESTDETFVVALSSSKLAVIFQDDENLDYGIAVIGNVTGNTIAFGSKYSLTYTVAEISAAALSSNKFIVAYHFGYNPYNGTVQIGNVSGSTITFGSRYTFHSANTDNISVAAPSSDKFVIAYEDVSNSNRGTAITGNVSGTTITFSSEYVFNAGITDNIFVTALSTDKFSVAYWDVINSDHGKATIGEIVPAATSIIPSKGVNTGSVDVTNLAGTDFVLGDTVKLTKNGQSDINATNVAVVSSTKITCTFDLSGAATGQWNVVVTNPDDQSGTLTNGFIVTAVHPSGTLIQVKSPYSPADSKIYLVQGTLIQSQLTPKLWIPDPYVFGSQFSGSKVVAVSAVERDSFSDPTPPDNVLPFRDGELVKQQSDPRIYVFADGQKHWITTLTVFNGFHYSGVSVKNVPAGELNQFTTGTNLSSVTPTHPNGALVQARSSSDPKIYQIQGGKKRWIPDLYVFSSYAFSGSKVIPISATERDLYTNDDNLPFRDGELVRDQVSGATYVFEYGLKRHITSPTVFSAYGYSWSNVRNVPAGELNQFSDGADLTL